MSEEFNEDLPTEEETPAQEAPKEEKEGDKADMSKIVLARVRQEQQAAAKREDELRGQIATLQKQLETGTKKSGKSESKSAVDHERYIPVEELPELLNAHAHSLKQEESKINFKKKLIDAAQNDEEFQRLIENGNSITAEHQSRMMHLSNAPEVVKHLLKDPKDYELLLAAEATSAAEMVRVINEISTRLEIQKNRPRPSGYEHIPNLSDAGDADQDFDLEEYVSNKNY